VSIHRSLAFKGKLKRQRNVLTRLERVDKLADEGRWNEGDTIFGLPTTRVVKVRGAKKKKKAPEPEQAEVAEGAEAPAAEEQEK